MSVPPDTFSLKKNPPAKNFEFSVKMPNTNKPLITQQKNSSSEYTDKIKKLEVLATFYSNQCELFEKDKLFLSIEIERLTSIICSSGLSHVYKYDENCQKSPVYFESVNNQKDQTFESLLSKSKVQSDLSNELQIIKKELRLTKETLLIKEKNLKDCQQSLIVCESERKKLKTFYDGLKLQVDELKQKNKYFENQFEEMKLQKNSDVTNLTELLETKDLELNELSIRLADKCKSLHEVQKNLLSLRKKVVTQEENVSLKFEPSNADLSSIRLQHQTELKRIKSDYETEKIQLHKKLELSCEEAKNIENTKNFEIRSLTQKLNSLQIHHRQLTNEKEKMSSYLFTFKQKIERQLSAYKYFSNSILSRIVQMNDHILSVHNKAIESKSLFNLSQKINDMNYDKIQTISFRLQNAQENIRHLFEIHKNHIKVIKENNLKDFHHIKIEINQFKEKIRSKFSFQTISYTQQINELSSHVNELKKNLETQKTTYENENSLLKSQVITSNSTINTLQRELDEQKLKSESESFILKSNIENLNSEIKELQKDLDNQIKNNEKEKSLLGSKIDSLNLTIVNLEAVILDKTKDYESATSLLKSQIEELNLVIATMNESHQKSIESLLTSEHVKMNKLTKGKEQTLEALRFTKFNNAQQIHDLKNQLVLSIKQDDQNMKQAKERYDEYVNKYKEEIKEFKIQQNNKITATHNENNNQLGPFTLEMPKINKLLKYIDSIDQLIDFNMNPCQINQPMNNEIANHIKDFNNFHNTKDVNKLNEKKSKIISNEKHNLEKKYFENRIENVEHFSLNQLASFGENFKYPNLNINKNNDGKIEISLIKENTNRIYMLLEKYKKEFGTWNKETNQLIYDTFQEYNNQTETIQMLGRNFDKQNEKTLQQMFYDKLSNSMKQMQFLEKRLSLLSEHCSKDPVKPMMHQIETELDTLISTFCVKKTSNDDFMNQVKIHLHQLKEAFKEVNSEYSLEIKKLNEHILKLREKNNQTDQSFDNDTCSNKDKNRMQLLSFKYKKLQNKLTNVKNENKQIKNKNKEMRKKLRNLGITEEKYLNYEKALKHSESLKSNSNLSEDSSINLSQSEDELSFNILEVQNTNKEKKYLLQLFALKCSLDFVNKNSSQVKDIYQSFMNSLKCQIKLYSKDFTSTLHFLQQEIQKKRNELELSLICDGHFRDNNINSLFRLSNNQFYSDFNWNTNRKTKLETQKQVSHNIDNSCQIKGNPKFDDNKIIENIIRKLDFIINRNLKSSKIVKSSMSNVDDSFEIPLNHKLAGEFFSVKNNTKTYQYPSAIFHYPESKNEFNEVNVLIKTIKNKKLQSIIKYFVEAITNMNHEVNNKRNENILQDTTNFLFKILFNLKTNVIKILTQTKKSSYLNLDGKQSDLYFSLDDYQDMKKIYLKNISSPTFLSQNDQPQLIQQFNELVKILNLEFQFKDSKIQNLQIKLSEVKKKLKNFKESENQYEDSNAFLLSSDEMMFKFQTEKRAYESKINHLTRQVHQLEKEIQNNKQQKPIDLDLSNHFNDKSYEKFTSNQYHNPQSNFHMKKKESPILFSNVHKDINYTKELQEANVILRGKIEELEKENSKMKAELDAKKWQLTFKDNELLRLDKSNEHISQEIKSFKYDYENLKLENIQLRQSNNTYMEQLKEKNQQLKNLLKKINFLEEKNKELILGGQFIPINSKIASKQLTKKPNIDFSHLLDDDFDN